MVLDEVKLLSDDAYYTEEHIVFLLGKYRAQVLKQAYSDIKKQIPSSNYQSIVLNIEDFNFNTVCGHNVQIKSTDTIPSTLGIGKIDVKPMCQFHGEICYTNRERFAYIGNNKWLNNIVYCTKGIDDYLYFKSNNTSYTNLKQVYMTAIFEDYIRAAEMANPSEALDVMEIEFPIEEGLASTVISMVVKDILGASLRPKDDHNNAKDDLSDIAQYIAKNVKSNLQKQISE